MNPLKDTLDVDVQKEGEKYIEQLQSRLQKDKEEKNKNEVNANLKRKSKYNFEIDDITEDQISTSL